MVFLLQALHFSPALYNYVTRDLGKALVVVLNKIDLAPPALVVAWTDYLKNKFPELHIVHFTSFPKDSTERNEDPRKGVSVRACLVVLWGAVERRTVNQGDGGSIPPTAVSKLRQFCF